jgi:CBS-domain-containing membrane protein
MTEITVGSIRYHPVRTIGHDRTVFEAARELYNYDVGSLIVIEGDEKTPAGIITKSDINMMVAEGKTPTECTVKEMMSTPLIVVTTTETIQSAAKRMRDHSIKKLPVTDKQGAVVGVLTASDLAYYLPTIAKKTHSHRPTHTIK